jgi:hypothetical protein
VLLGHVELFDHVVLPSGIAEGEVRLPVVGLGDEFPQLLDGLADAVDAASMVYDDAWEIEGVPILIPVREATL